MPTNPQIETEIDRLARAADPSGWSGAVPNGPAKEVRKDRARKAVRAVLLALREPSEGAVDAGQDECCHSGNFAFAWLAAIDHILNESDGQS